MNRIVMVIVVGLHGATLGCTPVQDVTVATCNRVQAEFSWWSSAGVYRDADMPLTIRRHFRCGYVQGYYDVCGGSCGTAPLFPPKCYWGAAYQTAYGTQCIHAWFSGYQEGAVTALRDGALGNSRLPTSWAPPLNLPHPSAMQPEPGAPDAELVPQGPLEEIPVPPISPAPSPPAVPAEPGPESRRRPSNPTGTAPPAAPGSPVLPPMPRAESNSPSKSNNRTAIEKKLPKADDLPRITPPTTRKLSPAISEGPREFTPDPPTEDTLADSETARRAYYLGEIGRWAATSAEPVSHSSAREKPREGGLFRLFNPPPVSDDAPPSEASRMPLFDPPPP